MTPGAEPVYDRIGTAYAAARRTDPRLATAIREALGDARTLVNVGAGTGAYEPTDRPVVAVEPSSDMVAQRPAGTAPCVRAVAEALPFRDGAAEATLAVLTIHHWRDQRAGLAELRRVARRRVVLFTWDPDARGTFWLTTEYFPAMLDLDVPRFPTLAAIEASLGAIRVTPVPIPHDCRDGFLGSYWRRPEAYLDPVVRSGISSFALGEPGSIRDGLARLTRDLGSGQWDARHGSLRARASLDLGYRLIVAERA